MLTKKSEMNKIAAEWAESNQYYDVAVSRYYYSVFQKMLTLAYTKNKNYRPPRRGDSHKALFGYIVRNYIICYQGKVSNIKSIIDFSLLNVLKSMRVKCDYRQDCLCYTEYLNRFKSIYIQINDALDQLINEVNNNDKINNKSLH